MSVGPPRAHPEAVIGVTIATQPPLWGELLARTLGGEPNLRILGRVGTEEELAGNLAHTDVDVVVFDFEALGPGAEGIIARLRRSSPRTRFLVLARRSDEAAMVGVLRAGASGLVPKHDAFATLVAAIRAVASGESWAHRRVTAQALEELSSHGRDRGEPVGRLTRRELQVVDCVSRGLRNRDIASALGISEKTVKTHLNTVFAKLGVRSRMELALWVQGQIQPTT